MTRPCNASTPHTSWSGWPNSCSRCGRPRSTSTRCCSTTPTSRRRTPWAQRWPRTTRRRRCAVCTGSSGLSTCSATRPHSSPTLAAASAPSSTSPAQGWWRAARAGSRPAWPRARPGWLAGCWAGRAPPCLAPRRGSRGWSARPLAVWPWTMTLRSAGGRLNRCGQKTRGTGWRSASRRSARASARARRGCWPSRCRAPWTTAHAASSKASAAGCWAWRPSPCRAWHRSSPRQLRASPRTQTT
mmetsp:Transcript_22098/g.69426  ORF Transcript_22098/g.69426 Transcript_22098/m.69426 type:complete len:243 (-) Transcript_22098:127-855(-)